MNHKTSLRCRKMYRKMYKNTKPWILSQMMKSILVCQVFKCQVIVVDVATYIKKKFESKVMLWITILPKGLSVLVITSGWSMSVTSSTCT